MKKTLLSAAALMILAGCQAPAPEVETAEDTLAPGKTLALSRNYVRAYTTLAVAVKSPKEFEGITISRGSVEEYWGAELSLTPDSVMIRTFDYNPETCRSEVISSGFAHGMTLGRKVKAEITTKVHDATGVLSVSSDGTDKSFDITWRGGGAPSVTNDGNVPVEASISFDRGRTDAPIWFIADSYFNEGDPDRWPWHMVQEGIVDGWFADHIPGGGTSGMLESFKNDLQWGTPEIAVWMIGMNDSDQIVKDDGSDGIWFAGVEEFISLCSDRGIEPVLCTVPVVPERNHINKTVWVRNSGLRYIEWYDAVGAKPWDDSEEDLACVAATGKHRGWTEGMLYEDDVHPTEAGAKALWLAVKEALPELSSK